MQRRPRTHVEILRLLGLFLFVIMAPAGCGDDPVDGAPDKLCREGAGFGARIAGSPRSLDMCVSNDVTSTRFGDTTPGRYDVAASTTADSVTIEIQVSFFAQRQLPASLVFTSNPGLGNFDRVWLSYREFKPGAYDYASTIVTGEFTLTFSDASIAVATFRSVRILLADASTGAEAGSRVISEGFISVTPDNTP